MKREDILRRVGSMQQLACVRPVTFAEGRAEHMRAVEVKNGPLQFQVLTDKGLDLERYPGRASTLTFCPSRA